MDNGLTDALVRSRRFFTRGTVSEDLRTLTQKGGRGADAFYRDRWSHDKVVRSTHGVNCTGSCSWKVYVKDGIITWETQQTDYPSVGPDSPEYEPRGCPRGAAFSWYTYSPTRVRYPYVRGVLLQMYREAKSQHDGDPVKAWAHIVDNPQRAKAYKSARGKGGLVRATWDEATEMVAAAYVHTIRKWGPDRVAGFSPIPAMSMVSHASGARFTSLVGGSMLSFYDWYADLPVASPQVFGDQTDVPESGDWWDAGYLVMWGSNVPVTRTPDAHWMTEARYRGQKVVVVAPDYADNVKFADEWLAIAPGTDGALAMSMGHVILKEFFVDRETPYFTDYTKKYTDLPYLVALDECATARRAPTGPASSSPPPTSPSTPARRTRTSRPCSSTPGPGTWWSPTAPSATASATTGVGQVEPRPRRRRPAADHARAEGGQIVSVELPRFDDVDGTPGSLPRDVPVRRVGDRLVTTVFDLMLAQYGVGRDGLTGGYADVVRRRDRAVHAGLAGGHHRRPRLGRRPDRPGVRAERRGLAGPLDDPDGRRHQPLVPLRHDLPRLPRADHAHRLPGRQRRRLGALRRPGEVPPGHRLGAAGVRAGLEAPAAADDPHRLLVPPHRPVPLRHLRRRHGRREDRQREAGRDEHGRRDREERADGLDAVVPDLRPQPARPRRRGGAQPGSRWPSTSSTS